MRTLVQSIALTLSRRCFAQSANTRTPLNDTVQPSSAKTNTEVPLYLQPNRPFGTPRYVPMKIEENDAKTLMANFVPYVSSPGEGKELRMEKKIKKRKKRH